MQVRSQEALRSQTDLKKDRISTTGPMFSSYREVFSFNIKYIFSHQFGVSEDLDDETSPDFISSGGGEYNSVNLLRNPPNRRFLHVQNLP